MAIVATDPGSGLARIDDDQDAEIRRGRDGFEAVGLLAGVLGVLLLLAATVGAAPPADLTSTAGSRSSPAQASAPVVDWYRIPDSNR